MTREEVFDGVQNIFRDIFDEDDMILSDTTSSEKIEDWDSLAQVGLILSIEKTFSLKLSATEVGKLENVGEMVKLISGKT